MSTDRHQAAPSRVRFAERCDFDQVMFLCHQLHEENGLFEMNEDCVREVLMTHFDRQGGIIGVIGEPGCLEASIVLRMSRMWYSGQTYLDELFSFVLPEFRRSNNAKELIDFAKNCAVDIGVPLVIGIISNHRTQAKVKLYQRKFGTPVGAFFVANAAGWE